MMKKTISFAALAILCSTNAIHTAASGEENGITPENYASFRGKNAYSILGLTPEATDEAIKKTYRILAHRLHPDRNRDREADAAEAFKIVADAYAKIASEGWSRESEKTRYASGDAADEIRIPASMFTSPEESMKSAKIEEWLAEIRAEQERLAAERKENEDPRIRASKIRVLAAQEKNKTKLEHLPTKEFDLVNNTNEGLFVLITYGGDYKAEATLKQYLNLLIQGGASETLLPLITKAEEQLSKSYPVTRVAAVNVKPDFLYRFSVPDAPLAIRIRVWPIEHKPQNYQLNDSVFGTPDDIKKTTLSALAVAPEHSRSLQYIELKKSPEGKLQISVPFKS